MSDDLQRSRIDEALGILQADVETRLSRLSLPAGTAAKLVVDPAALVAVGADDKKAAQRFQRRVITEPDVGPAPRHVRGDGHRAARARGGYDLGLPLVVACVEHAGGNTLRPQGLRELL